MERKFISSTQVSTNQEKFQSSTDVHKISISINSLSLALMSLANLSDKFKPFVNFIESLNLSNSNQALSAYLSKWDPPILKAPLRLASSLTKTWPTLSWSSIIGSLTK
jgi:hypothetical protein